MAKYHPELAVLAGILGNFYGESGVNPGAWESYTIPPTANPWQYIYDQNHPNMGGYGLGQWTNTLNQSTGIVEWRCYNLYQFMNSNGYADSSGNGMDDGWGQLDFLENEAFGQAGGGNGIWIQKTSVQAYPAIASFSDFMNFSGGTARNLAHDFYYCWEGAPSDWAFPSVRGDKADEFYQYMINNQSAWENDGQPNFVRKNSALVDSETKNNVHCCWYYFYSLIPPVPPGPTPPGPTPPGPTPPGPTPTESKSKFWMYLWPY